MSLEAMKLIALSEQSAETAVLEAKTKAKTMVAQAHQCAEVDYDESTKAIASELASRLEKAQQEAQSIAKTDREKVMVECKVVRDEAQKNIKSAISIVVEKVVSG